MTVHFLVSGSNAVTLVWDANSEPDLAGYRVYYREMPSTTLRMTDVGLNTKAVFDQLTSGKTYEFFATAYNLAGLESRPSTKITYTLPANGLVVEWPESRVQNVASYKVYYGEVNRPTWSRSTGDDTAVSLSGLEPGRTYYFYAVALDSQEKVVDRYLTETYTIPTKGGTGTLRLIRENSKPTVQVTSPTSGGTYVAGEAFALRVSATDHDGSIARVDYYIGSSLVASLRSAPFSTWWTPPAAGSYTVAAIAVDNEGSSTASAVVTVKVTPPLPPPVAPGEILAVGRDGEVELLWSASSGAAKYYVYRALSWGGPFVRIGSSASLGYLDTTVVNNTRYFYQVTAVNSQGESARSPMGIATPVPVAPAAPSSLTANGLEGAVTLSWPAVARAVTYRIERATSWSGPFASIGAADGPTFTDRQVTGGTRYFYRVQAQNAGGTSASSPVAVATPLLAQPAVPKYLEAVGGRGVITLSWEKAPGATSYTVYRANSGSQSFARIGTTSSTSFTDSGLADGASYSYRVAAENASGTSAPSGSVIATTWAPAPDAPSSLTTTIGQTGAIISWADAERATAYEIYRAETFPSGFKLVGVVTGNSYTDTAMIGGTRYFYYVVAKNSGGTSEPSPIAFAVGW